MKNQSKSSVKTLARLSSIFIFLLVNSNIWAVTASLTISSNTFTASSMPSCTSDGSIITDGVLPRQEALLLWKQQLLLF
jgi:hypothetical protein